MTSVSTYIIIPADENSPVVIGEVSRYEVDQFADGHVGDRPRTYLSRGKDIALTFSGTAVDRGLPLNQRAMAITWSHVRRYPVQKIYGDAVLTGSINPDGSANSVPDEIKHLLTEAKSFKIQVKPYAGDWRALEGQYDNWYEAYEEARKIDREFSTFWVEFRVAPA